MHELTQRPRESLLLEDFLTQKGASENGKGGGVQRFLRKVCPRRSGGTRWPEHAGTAQEAWVDAISEAAVRLRCVVCPHGRQGPQSREPELKSAASALLHSDDLSLRSTLKTVLWGT